MKTLKLIFLLCSIFSFALTPNVNTVAAAPLHDAAAKGDIDAVRNHIAGGEYVNFRDKEGLTALHWAVVKGQHNVAEFLIDNGADINATDNFGTTLLHMAIFGGEKIVKLLVDKGIRVDAKNDDGITALHLAALEGNPAMAELLVAKGSDVNAKTRRNNLTPLYWAAKRGHLTIVELLISNGADVNSWTKRGKTPLKVAIIKGHRVVAEVLLRHGASAQDPFKLVIFGNDEDGFFDEEGNQLNGKVYEVTRGTPVEITIKFSGDMDPEVEEKHVINMKMLSKKDGRPVAARESLLNKFAPITALNKASSISWTAGEFGEETLKLFCKTDCDGVDYMDNIQIRITD